MATAPTPGIGDRLDLEATQAELIDSGFRITCAAEGGREVTILLGDISAEDEIACLTEIGLTPTQLMNEGMGTTTVLVFYWLAQRQIRQKNPPQLKKLFRKYGTPRLFVEAGFEVFGIGLMADEDEDEREEGEESLDPSVSEGPSETPGPTGQNSTDSAPGTSEAPPS